MLSVALAGASAAGATVMPASAATGGQLWAWGDNWYGSLGDGTEEDRPAPVAVAGLTNVVKVETSGANAGIRYAIRADGTVWEWGLKYGKRNDGSTTHWIRPVRVSKLTKVVDLVEGCIDMCALRSDGTVWEWGARYNDAGKRTSVVVPRKIPGLSKIKSLVNAAGAMVALRSDGTVWTWGTNDYGGLGDGTTKARSKPKKIAKLAKVTKVFDGGNTVFAVRKDHTVWAWGDNGFSQLGDGTKKSRRVPTKIANLKNVISIIGGHGGELYGIRRDGTVLTWGFGQRKPKKVPKLSGIKKVVGGSQGIGAAATYALKKDGTVWAWGTNKYGQLGIGKTDTKKHPTPAKVPGLTKVKDIAADMNYAMALRTDGTVWSWGSEANPLTGREVENGALGLCGLGHHYSPKQVPGITNVTYLATSGWSTFVVGNGTGEACPAD